jgi:hypothetical protein
VAPEYDLGITGEGGKRMVSQRGESSQSRLVVWVAALSSTSRGRLVLVNQAAEHVPATACG